MSDEKEVNSELQKLNILKATAVRQAMHEVVGEQREEIIKRASAKLTAMGINVTPQDLGVSE